MHKIALATLGLLCLPAAARANVTYTFSNQVYGGESVALRATLNFTLVVSDAAATRGSFRLTEQTAPTATSSGDVADFVSFNFSIGPSDSGFFTPTSGSPFGSFQANLTLGSDFANGSITAFNATSHFALASSSTNVLAGESDSDANNCNAQGVSRCTVSGQLARVAATAVPEPTPMTLLGMGLFGLAALRRRA